MIIVVGDREVDFRVLVGWPECRSGDPAKSPNQYLWQRSYIFPGEFWKLATCDEDSPEYKSDDQGVWYVVRTEVLLWETNGTHSGS